MLDKPQSRGWRVFSVAALMLVLPYETPKLLDQLSLYDTLRYAFDTMAVIGLAGYAFGYAIGPRAAWRIFAPAFAVFIIVILLSGLPRLALFPSLSTGAMVTVGIFLPLSFAWSWFMTIGLLRYGGWLHGPEGRTVTPC